MFSLSGLTEAKTVVMLQQLYYVQTLLLSVKSRNMQPIEIDSQILKPVLKLSETMLIVKPSQNLYERSADYYLYQFSAFDEYHSLFKAITQLQYSRRLKNKHLLTLKTYQIQLFPDSMRSLYYFQLKTLHQYGSRSIKDCQKGTINQQTLWNIIKSAVDALSYLQRQGISYKMLTIEDFKIMNDRTIKLLDPAISTQSSDYYSPQCYYSPQMLAYWEKQGKQQNGASQSSNKIDIFKSDVFSLGMILMQMMLQKSCRFFYQGFSINWAKMKKKYYSLANIYSKCLLDYVFTMLNPHSEDRPTFVALRHQLISIGIIKPPMSLQCQLPLGSDDPDCQASHFELQTCQAEEPDADDQLNHFQAYSCQTQGSGRYSERVSVENKLLKSEPDTVCSLQPSVPSLDAKRVATLEEFYTNKYTIQKDSCNSKSLYTHPQFLRLMHEEIETIKKKRLKQSYLCQ